MEGVHGECVDGVLVGQFAGSVDGARNQRIALVRYDELGIVAVMASSLKHSGGDSLKKWNERVGLEELMHLVSFHLCRRS